MAPDGGDAIRPDSDPLQRLAATLRYWTAHLGVFLETSQNGTGYLSVVDWDFPDDPVRVEVREDHFVSRGGERRLAPVWDLATAVLAVLALIEDLR
jgi:hypothetical protein